MVNVNNYGNRFQPSVHYGRQNINNRFQMNACMRAYGGCRPSIFPAYQQTSISYNMGPSNDFVKGNVIGQLFNAMPNILQGGAKIFNTIKGWFG